MGKRSGHNLLLLVVWTFGFLYSFGGAVQQKGGGGGVVPKKGGTSDPIYALSTQDVCASGESWCSDLEETDKLALEAIRSLHHQLDDDQNGNIDLAETDDFLREELKYEKNVENRQKAFHRNDDAQVSVKELWETWRKSEVHNWTVEQTVDWLIIFVGLPQHQEKFINNHINGTVLPILAVNHNNYMQNNLGVKDTITRQRLAVKAMDVVLFGPPRDNTNRVKDVILTTLLAVAVIACYLVYKRYQWAQHDLTKMSKHMAELSKAEEALMDLQKELEKARTVEKKEAVVQSSGILGGDPEELTKLREENMVLRSELHRAEVELQDKCWVPPPALQHWLQYTYEMELKTYNKKKTGAEKQLKQAKDACDKLKKKRSSLMGAFVTTHGRSIDDVDKAILEARTALTEITYELQERMHRWKQMEYLIGCSIMNNPGIQYLENMLKVYGKPQSYTSGPGSVISNSQDDIDDDGASSIYCASAVQKLISSSTYLMFPGQNFPSASSALVYNFQQSPSSSSEHANCFKLISGNLIAQTENTNCLNRPCPPPNAAAGELTCIPENPVSGPTSQSHMQQLAMSRSKSSSSMLSLRDRGLVSRESSSKDSSNGEDEVVMDPSDITSARRVTFRADHRSRMKAYTNGRANGSLFDSMDNEEARRVVNRALSQTQSLESITSSSKPEDNEEASTKKPEETTPEPQIISNGHPQQLDESTSEQAPTEPEITPPPPITIGFVEPSSLYTSPKGKNKLWSTFTRIVHTNKGDNKEESLNKDKSMSKSMSKESVSIKKNGLLTASATTKKNGKKITGLFSSLRRHSEKADVAKLPVEA